MSVYRAVMRFLARRRVLEQCLAARPHGHVAEIGVYRGRSARWLCKAAGVAIYGFDTCTGLPEPDPARGDRHRLAEFACGKPVFPGCLVPGVFPDSYLNAPGLPARWSFVHIDVDLYESTRAALEVMVPRLLPGGFVVVDDYGAEKCQGARLAVDESGYPFVPLPTEQAVLRVGG